MAKRRSKKATDWPVWTLLFCVMVLALVVFTLEPLPGTSSEQPKHSLLGPAALWLGAGLFGTLGHGLYLLIFGWFLVVIDLLRKKHRGWAAVHAAGWLILLPLTSLLLDMGLESSARQRPGGVLGAWLHAETAELSTTHLTVLLSSWAFIGLVLAVPRVMARLGGLLLEVVRAWFAFVASLAKFLSTLGRRPVVAGDEVMEVEESSQDIPIRKLSVSDEEEPLEVQEAGPEPTILPIHRTSMDIPEQPSFADYELPPLTLLEDPAPFPWAEHDQKLRDTAVLLEKTFKDFELNVRVVGINTGPVITQYELVLETGLRVNKITPMSDDLALNLKVPSVRIVAPIPGKNTVGIEIPNEHRATVHMKEVILAYGRKLQKAKLPLFLGKDTEGRPLVYDLADMPHLLIAGRTGTGKSVCLNSIILSLLMTRRPDEAKMIMIDPKMLELSEYAKVPHLMHPVVKDMKKAEAILAWAVDKMEERYDLLSRARVRSIAGYNELGYDEILRRVQPDEEEVKRIHAKMPYIVIFVDEMGDLMMTMKREVEGHIIRLAQKSRAAGIHLVVATQKPTVDVITGLIKSNLPARICFQVSSRMDSRVVLDEMGAEKLLGRGDMLFLQPGSGTIMRAQGTYASDQEISRVVGHLECDQPCYAQELIQLKTSAEEGGLEKLRARDDMYEQAIEIVVREGRGSVSLLQRALGIGYGRAARLIDFMAEDGIVGAYNGSNAREVLYTPEDWTRIKEGAMAARA